MLNIIDKIKIFPVKEKDLVNKDMTEVCVLIREKSWRFASRNKKMIRSALTENGHLDLMEKTFHAGFSIWKKLNETGGEENGIQSVMGI